MSRQNEVKSPADYSGGFYVIRKGCGTQRREGKGEGSKLVPYPEGSVIDLYPGSNAEDGSQDDFLIAHSFTTGKCFKDAKSAKKEAKKLGLCFADADAELTSLEGDKSSYEDSVIAEELGGKK